MTAPGPPLRFLVSEEHLHGGSAHGTISLHGGLAIFHRHLLRVLHFRLLFALDTIGLGHLFSSFFSTGQTLGERACSLAPHCSTDILTMQEHAPRAAQASKMSDRTFASPVIIARDAARSPQPGDVLRGAAGETSPGH